MMLRTVATAIVIVMLSQPAHAALSNEGRLKLLGEITAHQDNFVLVRDRFFLGPQGLANSVDIWGADVRSWMEAWDDIWQDVKKLPQAADFDQARQLVEDRIALQNQSLTLLRNRADEFTNRADNVTSILFSKPVPAFEGVVFDHRIKELVRNSGILANQIVQIQESMKLKSARLNNISVDINKKLSAFVTAESLRPNSALKEKFRALKTELLLMSVADPFKYRLYELREKMALDLNNQQIFHAEAYLKEGARVLGEGQTTIGLTRDLPPDSIIAGKNSLAEIYNIMEVEFADLAGTPAERPMKVLRYAKASRKSALKFCKSQDPTVNCALAEWLDRIPAHKISNFDANKLKTLETAWHAVFEGNSHESLRDMKALVEGTGL